MNNMDERIEELFPFYAMGAISDEEKAEVEAYVQTNLAAQAQLAADMAVADDLAFLAEPMALAPAAKESVLAYARRRPHRTAAPAPVASAPGWWQRLRQSMAMPVLAGLATATAIILFIWVVSLRNTIGNLESQVVAMAPLESRVEELQSRVETLQPLETAVPELQRQINALQQELAQQDDVMAILREGQSLPIAGTEFQPTAIGQLLVGHDGQNALLVASDLATLPPEQTYQLWLIGDSGPVSEGVFTVNESGTGFLEVQTETAVFDYAAIGISVEPEGGSPQPTGDIVMLSEILSQDTDS